MGFTIEYQGDDTEILHAVVKHVADHRWVAEVFLLADGPRSIDSLADYELSDYRDGKVTLTLWDEQGPVIHPNGFRDVQVVDVDHIAELKVY